jgi:hypothetical protein
VDWEANLMAVISIQLDELRIISAWTDWINMARIILRLQDGLLNISR